MATASRRSCVRSPSHLTSWDLTSRVRPHLSTIQARACRAARPRVDSHWQTVHKGNKAAEQLEARWRKAIKNKAITLRDLDTCAPCQMTGDADQGYGFTSRCARRRSRRVTSRTRSRWARRSTTRGCRRPTSCEPAYLILSAVLRECARMHGAWSLPYAASGATVAQRALLTGCPRSAAHSTVGVASRDVYAGICGDMWGYAGICWDIPRYNEI